MTNDVQISTVGLLSFNAP